MEEIAQIFDGAGSVAVAAGTLAGLWGVARLFRWFQRDFSQVYRTELDAERRLRAEAEAEADGERARRFRMETRVALLEAALARHGVEVPPNPFDDA